MNSIVKVFATALLLGAVGCSTISGGMSPTSSTVLTDKFAQGQYVSSDGDVKMAVRTYIPEASRKLPLIVYLHGAGQNGSDNEKQLDGAVGYLYSFTTSRDDYSAILVAPQCPEGVYWRDETMLESLKDLIEKILEDPRVDSDRVIITGFSMGGDATWKLGLNYPDLMSTLVPVCGGPLASMEPDLPDVPAGMSDLNIWAFNNFDDGVVRPAYSKRIFNQLWEDDGDHLNFTLNVSGGHSYKSVYSNRDLLIWMLSTRKRSGK